jgi:hypothetical protein
MARLTKDAIIGEIIACGRDPIYFINKYARIQHPVRGMIPFKTYPYQDDVVRAYLNNRFNVLLKARQLGLSTITAAYIAWLILLHKDKNVLVVATKQDTAKNMIRTIRNIFKGLPAWIKTVAPITVDNRHSLELENGSRVKAVATSSDVGRSEAVSLLVVDECAFIPNFTEIWIGLGPTLSEGGQAALLSTPNGTGNFFHECWTKARNNENNFNCILGNYANPENPAEQFNDRLMWWVHPEHNQAWFEHETFGKSHREIAQEYCCNYNASGDTFIFHEEIQKLEQMVRPPRETFPLDRNVWIWDRPLDGAQYLISLDVSRGDAQDYSAFHVLRIDGNPLIQCAEYKGKIKPDELGKLVVKVAQYYNNATIAPENNSGWSGQTVLKIQEAHYPYLYYSRRTRPKYKDDYRVDVYEAELRNDLLPGYAVTSANRLPMLSKLEQYVRMGDIVMYSARFMDEVKTFIVKVTERGERPEAQRGYNDDLIMALAGGLWVREEAFMKFYHNNEDTAAMLAGMSTSKTPANSYKDFSFSTSASAASSIKAHIENQHKIVMGNGDELDISWLLTSG